MTRRFERTQRGPLHLSSRDCEALQALFTARYLTNRMICQLLYRTTTFSRCKQRLRYLYDAGYVRKRRVQINEPDIYYLGLKGRRYITSLGTYAREAVDRIAGVSGEKAGIPALMMGHDLALAQLYVDAVLECRWRGWALHWGNARMLELRELGVQPDAYLRIPEMNQQAFIEFTSVIPGHAEMKRKLEGYRQLLESLGGVPILWFTLAKGLGQLSKRIDEWAYHDWVLLGAIEARNEFLTRKMWRWSKRKELVQFVPPRETILYEQTLTPHPTPQERSWGGIPRFSKAQQ
jgi:hypothetical protein